MSYAKLDNGNLIPAPRKLELEMTFEVDGEPVTDLYTVYNPTAEQYASQGWLPVVETEMPNDAPEGYHYEPTYSEYMTADGLELVQEWELVEDDPPDQNPEISADEALEIIMGGGDE